MKKIFALLTIAGMLFFFGCGQAQQEATEEVETTEEVVEETGEEGEEVIEVETEVVND